MGLKWGEGVSIEEEMCCSTVFEMVEGKKLKDD